MNMKDFSYGPDFLLCPESTEDLRRTEVWRQGCRFLSKGGGDGGKTTMAEALAARSGSRQYL